MANLLLAILFSHEEWKKKTNRFLCYIQVEFTTFEWRMNEMGCDKNANYVFILKYARFKLTRISSSRMVSHKLMKKIPKTCDQILSQFFLFFFAVDDLITIKFVWFMVKPNSFDESSQILKFKKRKKKKKTIFLLNY